MPSSTFQVMTVGYRSARVRKTSISWRLSSCRIRRYRFCASSEGSFARALLGDLHLVSRMPAGPCPRTLRGSSNHHPMPPAPRGRSAPPRNSDRRARAARPARRRRRCPLGFALIACCNSCCRVSRIGGSPRCFLRGASWRSLGTLPRAARCACMSWRFGLANLQVADRLLCFLVVRLSLFHARPAHNRLIEVPLLPQVPAHRPC